MWPILRKSLSSQRLYIYITYTAIPRTPHGIGSAFLFTHSLTPLTHTVRPPSDSLQSAGKHRNDLLHRSFLVHFCCDLHMFSNRLRCLMWNRTNTCECDAHADSMRCVCLCLYMSAHSASEHLINSYSCLQRIFAIEWCSLVFVGGAGGRVRFKNGGRFTKKKQVVTG